MITWNQFVEYAEAQCIKNEYIEQTKSFFECLDPAVFDRFYHAERVDKAEIMRLFPGNEFRRFLMVLAVASWPEMLELYRKENYSAQQLEDIKCDLALWLEKFSSDNVGITGIDFRIMEWIRSVRTGEVLQFGRLQCNNKHAFCGNVACFEGPEGTVVLKPQKEHCADALLSNGDPAICLHIPASGPLKRELCIDSLRKMTAFFNERKLEYKAVVCYSWILDPVFTKIMQSTNLADFQKLGHLFRLDGCDQTDEIVWRVFNIWHGTPADIGDGPWNSGMQRSVAAYLKTGGRFCEYGMVILKKELDDLLK